MRVSQIHPTKLEGSTYATSAAEDAELDRRPRAMQVQHPHIDYRSAVHEVLVADAALAGAYTDALKPEHQKRSISAASVEADGLVRERLQTHPREDCGAPLAAVLKGNRQLARRHARGDAVTP